MANQHNECALHNYGMKSTLVIAFNGGAYGTYLEWVLNSLITHDEIKSPFNNSGASHKSQLGKHLSNLQGFCSYLERDEDYPTARLHPKSKKHESLQTNIEFLLDNTQHLILLYPDRDHELMCVCNYVLKIWKGDPYDGAMAYINPNDIYQGYGIAPGTDLRTIPTWIRREHMSFNLFTSWHAQTEWYFPDRWQDSRAMIITTKELFYDFENMLMRIRQYWNRPYVREISDMVPFHDHMISLQEHLGKDDLCAAILQCVMSPDTHEEIDYGELCIVSQAWLQYQLRLQGFELRCHDLDIFPTNTKDLRQLTYAV